MPARSFRIFFLQSYIRGLWAHTWSLAVEEHFYLVLPFLLYLSTRHGVKPDALKHLPFTILMLAGTCLTIRIINAASTPHYSNITHLFPTHLRIDSLAFGVLIAYYRHFKTGQFTTCIKHKAPLFLIAGIACLAPAFAIKQQTFWIHTFGLTLFYIGSGLILLAAVATPITHRSFSPLVTYIGARSYSIYLWHFPVIVWIIAPVRTYLEHQGSTLSTGTAIVIYIILSFGLGILAANLLELPVVAWRNRRFPNAPATPPKTV